MIFVRVHEGKKNPISEAEFMRVRRLLNVNIEVVLSDSQWSNCYLKISIWSCAFKMASPNFYTKTQINHWKVDELKAALSERGLDTSGTRPELQKRLRHEIHPIGNSQPNTSIFPKDINGSTQIPSATENDQWDIIKIKQGPVFKRIPKASRLQCSLHLQKFWIMWSQRMTKVHGKI